VNEDTYLAPRVTKQCTNLALEAELMYKEDTQVIDLLRA
jgi:hypothetical protein